MCSPGSTDDDAHHARSGQVGSTTGMCKAEFPDDDAPRAGTFPVGSGTCKAGFAHSVLRDLQRSQARVHTAQEEHLELFTRLRTCTMPTIPWSSRSYD